MSDLDIKPTDETLRRHPQRGRRQAAIPTPDVMSPLKLLQEELWENPWQFLVASIMLQQTPNIKAREIFTKFMERWPNEEAVLSTEQEHIAEQLVPIGKQNQRAKNIVNMTRAYITWDAQEIRDLPGISRSVAENWYVFVDPRILKLEVEDNELAKYVLWAQRRHRLNEAVKGARPGTGIRVRQNNAIVQKDKI